MRTRPQRPREVPESAEDRLSDAALVERALAEPIRPAFRELYERHERAVYRFLYKLLGEASLAEDVLQETFLNVHRSLASFDPSRAFKPWLFRIARNAGLNALRAQRKSVALEGDVAQSGDTPSGRVAAVELADTVQRALAALDDDDRALLILRHVFDTRVVELAETYGLGERAMRKRLQRAGERLAQALITTRGGAQ